MTVLWPGAPPVVGRLGTPLLFDLDEWPGLGNAAVQDPEHPARKEPT